MELEKRKFTLIEEVEYDGYRDPNEQPWNGWSLPYFTKEVAEKIYNDVTNNKSDGYSWEYDSDKKEFKATMEDGEWLDDCSEVVIDGMELYRVGAFNFCWDYLN